MQNHQYIIDLRVPTKDNPLRILMSACLAGFTCGYDGTANGEYPSALKLFRHQNACVIKFCPEEYSFGTPREMCDIHGGTGMEVLEGKAKVLTESGIDWTKGMIDASEKMLELAIKERIEIAILMDISAACGSAVIYKGNRFSDNKQYQIGAGVCAAQLIRNGIEVMSQRDFKSLEYLYLKLDENHSINNDAKDHHQTEWFQNYFKKAE